MTKQEVRQLLAVILPPAPAGLGLPTAEEWEVLEVRLGARFPEDLKHFIELMSEFAFPGDVYNVPQAAPSNGNDTMDLVYRQEVEASHWPADWIPFYGVGNGDYFAVRRQTSPESGVYYWYHEKRSMELYARSVKEWLEQLPTFLEGG